MENITNLLKQVSKKVERSVYLRLWDDGSGAVTFDSWTIDEPILTFDQDADVEKEIQNWLDRN